MYLQSYNVVLVTYNMQMALLLYWRLYIIKHIVRATFDEQILIVTNTQMHESTNKYEHGQFILYNYLNWRKLQLNAISY